MSGIQPTVDPQPNLHTQPAPAPGAPRQGLVALARVAVLLVFAVCLIQMVRGLPLWHDFLQTPCAAPCEDDRMTVSQWIQAHQAGISPATYATAYVVQAIVLAAVSFGVAGLILWRRPSDLMAYLVALALVLLGGTFFGIDEQARAASGPLALPLAVLNDAGFLLFPLLAYLFPTGRFIPRWARWVMLLLAGLLLLSYTPLGWWLEPLALPFLLLYVLPAIYAQIHRYRFVSTPVQREQSKWVLYALVMALGAYLLALGANMLFDAEGRMAPATKLFIESLFHLTMLFVPLAIGIAMLRHGLFDIDLLIRRTLQYTLITALLALVYLGVVLLLEQAFRTLTLPLRGQSSQLAIVLSTLSVAALFQPVRARVQGWVDRRFYRGAYDAQRVLEGFSRAARDETDLGRLAHTLAEVVQETLQPAQVVVWVATDGESLPLHAHGDARPERAAAQEGEGSSPHA